MDFKERKFVSTFFEDNEQHLSQKLEKIKRKGLPKRKGAFYLNLYKVYENQGLCDYLLSSDAESLKNYLYNACFANCLKIKWYEANSGNVNISSNLSMLNFWSVFLALVSDSEEMIDKCIDLLGGRCEFDSLEIDKDTFHVGYALKFLLISDEIKAEKHIKELLNSDRTFYYYYYGLVFQAILTRKNDLVQDTLNEFFAFQLSICDKSDVIERNICIASLALTKLAKRILHTDFKVNKNSDYVDIIEKSDIKYSLFPLLDMEEY